MTASEAARRVLVTGASTGIGAATTRLLARAGYRVALLARRRAELERLALSLPQPERHLVLCADVADDAALGDAFLRLKGTFGGLELLVNNAGVGCRATLEQLDPEAARRTLAVNVLGALRVLQLSLPLLRNGTRPVVVNVSSVVARHGVPGQALYAASKAALSSFGQALRIEWEPYGIAVCTLEPGLTATEFFGAQVNPAGLPPPDLRHADSPEKVGRAILELDRRPHRARCLRAKWKALQMLDALWPSMADRQLARRLGSGWKAPTW